MKRSIPVYLLLILLTLVACSPKATNLKNTAWVLTSLNGAELVEGTTITLVFEKDNLGGTSGCNQYGGEYKITGTMIKPGALMMTEMACMDAGVMEQESAYLQALSGELAYSLEGDTLTLTSSEGKGLVFTRQMSE